VVRVTAEPAAWLRYEVPSRVHGRTDGQLLAQPADIRPLRAQLRWRRTGWSMECPP